MVLTNFECWAHSGMPTDPELDTLMAARHIDPFNLRSVHQTIHQELETNPVVSHISSNGYYGFSLLNPAHRVNINNMNENNQLAVQSMDVASLNEEKRGKKRCFIREDISPKCAVNSVEERKMCDDHFDETIGSKRCRFDEDCSQMVEYWNDDLKSRTMGIVATQSCLMDTDEVFNKQQDDKSNNAVDIQSPQLQLQTSPLQHQQYQGHLHRANRDVSRCMFSHMI